MTLTEDLDTFLNDFGVTVTDGSVSSLGILDMPDQIIGDVAISTEYSVVCKVSDFGSKKYGDSLTVNSVAYTVRDNKKFDDGSFCRITLEKT